MTLDQFNKDAKKLNMMCYLDDRGNHIVTTTFHKDYAAEQLMLSDWYGTERQMKIEDLDIEIVEADDWRLEE